MKAILSVNKMSAGTKRSNADEDNNDETPTNANTGILISEPVKKGNNNLQVNLVQNMWFHNIP